MLLENFDTNYLNSIASKIQEYSGNYTILYEKCSEKIEKDSKGSLEGYARFLKRYQPRMFVFENVMGIESANGGRTWKNIKKYLKRVGYEIECHEQNSKTFGVLQNRRRMIIVGWLKNSNMKYPKFANTEATAIVNDLFDDLPKLHPGESATAYAPNKASKYVKETRIRVKDDVLTHHISRPNKERDISIYKRAIELWNDGNKRLNYNDLPDDLKTHKNRNSFLDRFKVVEGDEKWQEILLKKLIFGKRLQKRKNS